ncbi:TIR domain-containing protein, partial [Endothiovibrio diazotrophicus]
GISPTPRIRQSQAASEIPVPGEEIEKRAAPDANRKIFISYAHEDISWAKTIKKSLSILSYKQDMEIWIDRAIETGERWEETIYTSIEHSSIAILLLSSDFLSSDFILRKELPRIFAEKERRYLKVFPILIRHCPYTLHEELSKFQFFNDPERPYSSLQHWEIEKELTKLAYEIANKTN